MLDLYLVITPIFGFLSLLTLINLKLTLTEPKTQDLKKYQKKAPSSNNVQIEPIVKMQVKDQAMEPGYKKTLLYLLKNFTLADWCFVRRSRNKIPLLLSLPIVAILQIALNIPYAFCAIGPIITLLFVAGKALSNQDEPESADDMARIRERVKQKEEKFEPKLELILTSLTLLLNLIFIGLSFKNYRNMLLESAAYNFLVAIAIDNLVLKPIVLIIAAYPVKNVEFFDAFINKEIQIVQIIHQERVPIKVFDAHISALSPKKLYNSPSKVPKALHVEPRISSQNKENYISTLQLAKSLMKPKLSPINAKRTLQAHNQDDCSLISILNSNEKKKNHAFDKNNSFDFDKSFQEKVQQENEAIPEVKVQSKRKDDEQSESKYSVDGNKKNNRMRSSKLILINQDNSIIKNFENDIENQEEDEVNHNKSGINPKSLRDSDYKSSSRNCDGLKISLHKSIDDERDHKENFDAFFEEELNPNVGRPHSTLEEDNSMLHYGTITHTSRRDGLLKINEDKKGEDLQEIDLNSPERRKNQLSKIVEDAQIEKVQKKKKHKKYSLDPNRHVIKHSTGEPYLQFLPNLLNKERQEKKKKSSQQVSQQAFSNKMEMVNGYFNDSRLSKSVKRPKNGNTVILKHNDENKIPEFMIEDFN